MPNWGDYLKNHTKGIIMNVKRYWLILGSAALVSAAFLAGCSGSEKKDRPQEEAAAAAPASPAAQNEAAKVPEAAEVQPENKPGRLAGGLVIVTAKVQAIDKKNRVVTLKYPDGKLAKVKCGPEVRNFAKIRKGDDVTAQFLETVELYATGEDIPSAERATEVGRAPLGSKPGFSAIDALEIKASVEAIDYQTREVTLKNAEGKLVTMKAGPEVKRLNEVKKGDTVVARLVRAVSIEVSKPAKK
jgi:hypothetical protein